MFGNNIKIPGLSYISEYITQAYEAELIKIINLHPWAVELKRRVQHYGYKYDYKNRIIDSKHYLGPIPSWLHDVCKKLHTEGIVRSYPDQVIVNEYLSGQGISAHIDCILCFGNVICSLSLGAECIMDFTKGNEKKSLLLEPRSLLILQDDARFSWKHSITARKPDEILSVKVARKLRLSLTFRNVIVN